MMGELCTFLGMRWLRLGTILERYHCDPLASSTRAREALRRRGHEIARSKAIVWALIAGCSSTPALDVAPRDAGSECSECWATCSQTTSRKAASFCSLECDLICEQESK